MSRFKYHRAHLLLIPTSHFTMASKVKSFCPQNLLNLVSMVTEFYADQYLQCNLLLTLVHFWVIDPSKMGLVTIVQRVNLFLSQKLLYYVPLGNHFHADQYLQWSLWLIYFCFGIIDL